VIPDEDVQKRIAAALHAKMPGCTHDEHGSDCEELAAAVVAEVAPSRDVLKLTSDHLDTCYALTGDGVDPGCPCQIEHPLLFRVTATPTDGRKPESKYFLTARQSRFWRDQVRSIKVPTEVSAAPMTAFWPLLDGEVDMLAQAEANRIERKQAE
jgi:hypothetical protein